jgi:hypothetical protein
MAEPPLRVEFGPNERLLLGVLHIRSVTVHFVLDPQEPGKAATGLAADQVTVHVSGAADLTAEQDRAARTWAESRFGVPATQIEVWEED